MKKVYQTRFGGQCAPVEEKGNCFQAAVASVLELSLDDVPNIQEFGQDEDGEWLGKFRRWLSEYSLGIRCIGLSENHNNGSQGYHLIESESTTLDDEHHILVGLNGVVVHDPNPNAESNGKQIYHWVFVALDPSKVRV